MSEWPEKKEGSTADMGFEDNGTAYVDGWNNAIDACKAAQPHRLEPIDNKKVQEVFDEFLKERTWSFVVINWEDGKQYGLSEFLAKIVTERFGSGGNGEVERLRETLKEGCRMLKKIMEPTALESEIIFLCEAALSEKGEQ